jgi:hypothetical protein
VKLVESTQALLVAFKKEDKKMDEAIRKAETI